MGIVNVTPDSFFARSRVDLQRVLIVAEQMIQDGADMLDIGGESTRPGAEPVALQEELDRVIPAIELLSKSFDIPISIDTQKTEVMSAAVQAGASFINDINALQAPDAIALAATLGVDVCLMHKKGSPLDMQSSPTYQHVVEEVFDFLHSRYTACIEGGILPSRITLDPGFGFGKTLAHNLQLLKHLARFKSLGCPLLVGMSRKSMLGDILHKQPDQRLIGGVALTTVALLNGADIIRTHDVGATKDAVQVVAAYQKQE